MTRRKFGALLGAAGAACLTGAAWLVQRAIPARAIVAVRGRLFPGKLRRLTDREIRTPGPWRG